MNKETLKIRNQKLIEISQLSNKISTIQDKVLLSLEYAMAGDEPPYSFAELHSEAQSYRSRIIELDAEIKEMESESRTHD